jgi:hypothetical protein
VRADQKGPATLERPLDNKEEFDRRSACRMKPLSRGKPGVLATAPLVTALVLVIALPGAVVCFIVKLDLMQKARTKYGGGFNRPGRGRERP